MYFSVCIVLYVWTYLHIMYNKCESANMRVYIHQYIYKYVPDTSK